MAVRTNESAVLVVMGRTTNEGVNVDSYISTANLVINAAFARAGVVETEEILTEIEKWYTAHLLACSVWRQASEEKVGDATIKYVGEYGTGLDLTSYGQMVKQLDIKGVMQSVSKKQWSIRSLNS